MNHTQIEAHQVTIAVKTFFDEEGCHNFVSIDFTDDSGENTLGFTLCSHVAKGIAESIDAAFMNGLVALDDCKNVHMEWEGKWQRPE